MSERLEGLPRTESILDHLLHGEDVSPDTERSEVPDETRPILGSSLLVQYLRVEGIPLVVEMLAEVSGEKLTLPDVEETRRRLKAGRTWSAA